MGQRKRFMPISAASGSIQDMLGAFENKLDEIGGSTKVQAGYDPLYEDLGGGFTEPGGRIRYSEIKDYWDRENQNDPVLREYNGDFDTWWDDTRMNYLREVDEDDIEGCGGIQAATINDMLTAFEDKLDSLGASTSINAESSLDDFDNIDDYIWELAQKYTSSVPLSGSWDTEDAYLLKELMDKTGLSEGECKSKMISVLGYEPEDVYQLEPLEASTTIEAADSSDELGEDYIKNLMDEVAKKMRASKTEYEIDDQEKAILLTSVSRDGVIVEYTIPLEDLKSDLKTDVEYILKAVEES